ncbi:MAG TPA: hypothetical protein VK178_18805 [Opitutaceae bacterium]|nr:hypothetical protein [Opitutaceae bacterium]
MESPTHFENRPADCETAPDQPPGAGNAAFGCKPNSKPPGFGKPGEIASAMAFPPRIPASPETGGFARPKRVGRNRIEFPRQCVSAPCLYSRHVAKRPFQVLVAMLAIANQTPPCISSAPFLAALSGVIANHLKRGKTAVSLRSYAAFGAMTKGPCQ